MLILVFEYRDMCYVLCAILLRSGWKLPKADRPEGVFNQIMVNSHITHNLVYPYGGRAQPHYHNSRIFFFTMSLQLFFWKLVGFWDAESHNEDDKTKIHNALIWVLQDLSKDPRRSQKSV